MKKALAFPMLAIALFVYADDGQTSVGSRMFLAEHWVTSWAASAQGPFPSGFTVMQPSFSHVFPQPKTGAVNQSFRMIVRPDVWGAATRIQLSNAYGTKPVTFDDVFVGLQAESSEVMANTNTHVTFGGLNSVTVQPGSSAWSDAVPIMFAGPRPDLLQGRKLAISFHVPGPSGPITWHAKALTTSYMTAPGSGSKSAEEEEAAFPFSVTSWFFVDAVDMMMPRDTNAIVTFGDSITDGEGATLNSPDRWPDILSRRLHRRFGDRVSVVNAAITGNQVAGPVFYSAENPSPGGPAAVDRLERDVLGLSGVSTVIWFEGTNDISENGFSTLDMVKEKLREGVQRIRTRLPKAKIIGATLTSARGDYDPAYGSAEHEQRREALNSYVRTSGLFDYVIDFDAATTDPASGELRPELAFSTSTDGAGDKLHPNRLGYLAMGAAADVVAIRP
jgi:lysophospholipase L1-like esterase